MKKGILFVVSAPTGAGKTSLTNHVIQSLKNEIPLSKIITYTTRPQRVGEIDGVDYHFISQHEFNAKKAAGMFLEVTTYNGNNYGSPRSVIDDLDHGKSFFIVVDRPGARNLKNLIVDPVMIWLAAPNLTTLHERIKNRATTSGENISNRLMLADQETAAEKQDPCFTYHVINDNFDNAAQEIIEIIRKTINPVNNA